MKAKQKARQDEEKGVAGRGKRKNIPSKAEWIRIKWNQNADRPQYNKKKRQARQDKKTQDRTRQETT
jgi:hypothetical protein